MLFRAVVLIAALAAASVQAAPRDKLLVTPAWLAAHVADKNLVLLHSGDQASFDAGHIPGARLVAVGGLAAPQEPGGLVLELPQPDALHSQLQALGISDTSRIVVYQTKDQIQAATRIVFTLQAAGLGDRVALLDGGLEAWKAAGHITTGGATPERIGRLKPLKMRPTIVDAAFVRTEARAPGYAIIDARAAIFYDGVQPGGLQGPQPKKGHIPGAKNVPFTSISNPDLTLKSPEDLAAAFKAAGVKPGDKLVVYCHVGQQATAVVFAARTLGLDAQLYDGSFQDWSMKGLPVETPAPAK
jgi:thiosulfate/3-mercaptopyruvate sulfurtransferase